MMVCSDKLTGCMISKVMRKIAKLNLQAKIQQNPGNNSLFLFVMQALPYGI
jgi:hypothetical protein